MTVEKDVSNDTRVKSADHVDILRESERQSSIFGWDGMRRHTPDFQVIRRLLKKESRISDDVVDKVIGHVSDHMEHLGLKEAGAGIIVNWMVSLLREQGVPLDDIPLQQLELSLSDVELNIYHPLGHGQGPEQNPEATSQRIARKIKAQFAARRIFQEEVIAAQESGDIELLHLGSVDRPHDVFLTPDYLKIAGLPKRAGAPAAGPAKKPEVLLAHMIRFTHELQNHFAGDIQWGFVNTLLLPFIADMSDDTLYQFVQQILFEFGQLDVERGGLNRRVVLDFDFEIPRQLVGLPARGPGGRLLEKTYGDYKRELVRFNDAVMAILDGGDERGNPFHAPQIVFHLNDPSVPWSARLQMLMELSFRWGNPAIALSYHERDFGALGRIPLNDPDFLSTIREPAAFRGFSISSVAINLPRLARSGQESAFFEALERCVDVAVSAHRQKRLFLSRLMAYGTRGPLQFLRHKIGEKPFIKIDKGSQPMQLVGLAEAALLLNGSPKARPGVLAEQSERLLARIVEVLESRNRAHKLKMVLHTTKDENLAYRFAFLDLKRFGNEWTPVVFHGSDQSHPIYTEGPNILAFQALGWKERMRLEAPLHKRFGGHHAFTLFLKNGVPEDDTLYHRVFQEARAAGVSILQPAPDLNMCMTCYQIFGGSERRSCPGCKGSLVSPYGWCQAGFSPVNTWCLGKRSEWKIRRRVDDYKVPVQQQLPW